MKKSLLALSKVAVSVGGLAFVFFIFRDRLGDVGRLLRNLDSGIFLLSLLVFLLAFWVVSFRLQSLLKVQKVHLRFGQVLYLNFVGHFFSLFLPSAIGGDVVKGYYIYKRSGEKAASFTAIFLDRLVGSLSVLSLGLISLFYFSKLPGVSRLRNAVVTVSLMILFVMIFLFNKNFARRFRFLEVLAPSQTVKDALSHLYHRIHYYWSHKRVLFKVYLISLVTQMVFISVYYLLARSLRFEIPYFNFFLVIPIVSVLSMAPSINGLGVREAGFVYLMGWFTSPERALALSLAYDGLIYGSGLLFGLLYVMREGFRRGIIHEAINVEKEAEKVEDRIYG